MPTRHPCPKCNLQEDLDLHNIGAEKKNRNYVLVFMRAMSYQNEKTWISPGVYYCHECGHLLKEVKE